MFREIRSIFRIGPISSTTYSSAGSIDLTNCLGCREGVGLADLMTLPYLVQFLHTLSSVPSILVTVSSPDLPHISQSMSIIMTLGIFKLCLSGLLHTKYLNGWLVSCFHEQ